MNLSAEKLDLIQKIIQIQDDGLLSLLKSILSSSTSSKTDWWDNITQAEKDSINRGLEDLQKGNIISHDQIRNKYEKWLKD